MKFSFGLMLIFRILVFHKRHLHPKRNQLEKEDEKIIPTKDENIYIYFLYSNFVVKLIEILEGWKRNEFLVRKFKIKQKFVIKEIFSRKIRKILKIKKTNKKIQGMLKKKC